MNFNENKAIYLQICDTLGDSILNGVHKANDRIPSVREYAATLEVNANTVMRSYEYMERQGILYNKRGIGFFVTDDASDIIRRLRRSEFFSHEIEYFFNKIHSFGISPEEIENLYAEYCENKQNK